MNTTRMKELLHEFKVKGICKDSKQKEPFANMLEWQDHIGRSNVREIVSFWESLPRRSDDGIDQDTFLWANQSTLNPDMVNSIYRDTAGMVIKKQVAADARAELEKEWTPRIEQVRMQETTNNSFIKKLNEFEITKQKLQEEVQRLTDEHNAHIESTDDLVHRYENQIENLIQERHILSDKGVKLDTLKSLLKELTKDEKESEGKKAG